ncbi:MAG: ParB/RepB/Spo0J family partition protein [Candidatus Palauibacterales bacterium]|nr:ParB/RepB/Spo0J family partition protein [Candidatus Palauibacterales bacterium]MDP2530997.1 ParB/RepB/Spo0J family partition protein [Candidatus Palauibacterales bacterium]MDP2583440.1 ParB/RepB/Spo0J family partition protein [Candidatus Palauibacterales bacterium]
MAKGESRLGKGLGALLGEYMEEGESRAAEREVPVTRIRPNPFQPRTEFEPSALAELAESIRANGLLQPLVVRPSGEEWEIVAGERRWRALQELGRKRAPVIVRELSDEQMLVLALVENLQRESLSPLDEALGYRQLQEGFGLTQQEVAERVGQARPTVTNALRLLHLPDSIQALLAGGRLTAGHGRALLGLEDEEAQLALARKVVADDLSVRATERRVRRLKDGGEEKTRRRRGRSGRSDPVADRAGQLLERTLGTQVRVSLRGPEEGEIGIVFHDADEFERLVRIMAGEDASELFDGS